MSEKKQITIRTYSDSSECDTNLKEFIEKITKNIPDNYLDKATINIDGYEGVEVAVFYDREETDEEYVNRIAIENKYCERNKENEIKHLKALIAKHGIPEDIKQSIK